MERKGTTVITFNNKNKNLKMDHGHKKEFNS